MSRKRTIIYFDYGGYYVKNGGDLEWNARKEEIYYVMIKASKKDVSYSKLVEEIRKKIMVDESTKLKLSFIPIQNARKRPLYIRNDEDVYMFLVTEVEAKSVLYVELIDLRGADGNIGQEETMEQQTTMEQPYSMEEIEILETQGSMAPLDIIETQESVQPRNLRFEEVSDIGLTNNDPTSSGGAFNFEGDEVIVEDDNVDPVGFGEVAQLPSIVEWEDGFDMAVGQVFETKRDVQDKIEKASRENCFEFDIIKTDKKLYVVKCREAKNGCNWRIRAALDKSSSCFSVRTYINTHRCSRSSTSTSKSRRKGSAKMIASFLNDDYPGQLNLPAPNALLNMVQNRFGY